MDWDAKYLASIKDIPLFDPNKIKLWNQKQREYFVKILYHARGHFHDVLWYMGNFAQDEESKQVILDNIADEFGKKGFSHEKLYLRFAEAVGVDLSREFIKQENYLPFLKEFNRGHLEWMSEHDWEECASFFAALERLDNVDYIYGKNIAESLGLTGKALTFFDVHIYADHFNPVCINNLISIWESVPQKVEDGFYFVRTHQAVMWEKLSHAIFSYGD